MPTLSTLLVRMDEDSAKLQRGLKKVRKDGKATEKSFKRLGRTIEQALAATVLRDAGRALTGFVHNTALAADETTKLAKGLGITTEKLSQLQYAAGISGANNAVLTNGLRALTRNMGDAAKGTGESADAVRAMGLSVLDANGHIKNSGEFLEEVADKFRSYEDGAAKSALAQKLFSRAGIQMVPMLNEGAEGLRKLAKESDRYGKTISGKTAKAAEEFNDNIFRMSSRLQGIGNTVLKEIAPAFVQLTDDMNAAKNAGESMDEAGQGLAIFLKGIASSAVIAAAGLEQIGIMLGGLAGKFATSFKHIGLMKRAIDAALEGDMAAQLRVATEIVNSMDDIQDNRADKGVWDEMAAAAERSNQRLKSIWSKIEKTNKEGAQKAMGPFLPKGSAPVIKPKGSGDPGFTDRGYFEDFVRQNAERQQELESLAEKGSNLDFYAPNKESLESDLAALRRIEDASQRQREESDKEALEKQQDRLREARAKQLEEVKEHHRQIKAIADRFSGVLADNLFKGLDGILEGNLKGFEDFFENVIKGWARMLARMVAELIARQTILALFNAVGFATGGGGGAVVGGFAGQIASNQLAISAPTQTPVVSPTSAQLTASGGGGGGNVNVRFSMADGDMTIRDWFERYLANQSLGGV